MQPRKHVRPGRVRGALFASAVALCALLAGAGAPARAEPAALTPLQFALATPAMRLAALGRDGLDPAERPLAQAELRRLGYGWAGPGLAAGEMRLRPLLSYDPNANGGYEATGFDLGGFAFRVDPDYRARARLMAGLRGQANAVFALGGRFAAEAFLDARYLHALGGTEAKSTAQAGACLRQGLSARTSLRECLSTGFSRTTLGFSRGSAAEIGLSHGFGLGPVLLEGGGVLRRARLAQGARQWQGTATLATVWPGATRLDLALSLGEPVASEVAMRHRLGLALTRQILGEWTRIELAQEQRAGGQFLGSARRERRVSARLVRGVPLVSGRGRPLAADLALGWELVTARQSVLAERSLTVELSLRF